jgi:predicted RNA-binding protein with TRAM domain
VVLASGPLVAAPAFANSSTFSAPDFTLQSLPSNTSLITSTTETYLEIELTPKASTRAGGAWYKSRVNLNSDFSIQAEVYLGDDDAGADGMAFVMQPLSTTQLTSGGGLGYSGITPSFAVEIDTFANASDPAADHVGLMLNTTDHNSPLNTARPPVALGQNIEDDEWRKFEVSWNSVNETVTVKLDVNANGLFDEGETLFSGTNVPLKSHFGDFSQNVYWGFTAATGGSINRHAVRFPTDAVYVATARVNNAPVISLIAPQLIAGAETLTIPLNFSDDDSTLDQLSVAASSSNDSVATAAATLTSATDGTISVSALAAGTSTITVAITDADGAVSSLDFAVEVVAPDITELEFVSTAEMFTAARSDLTITGTGFDVSTIFRFGTEDATVVSVTDTSAVVRPPEQAGAGSYVVRAISAGLQSDSLVFDYSPLITVSSISPDSGRASGNFAITITGANFDRADTVVVDGVSYTSFTNKTATQIALTIQSRVDTARTVGAEQVVVKRADNPILRSYDLVYLVFRPELGTPNSSKVNLRPVASRTRGDLNKSISRVGDVGPPFTFEGVDTNSGLSYEYQTDRNWNSLLAGNLKEGTADTTVSGSFTHNPSLTYEGKPGVLQLKSSLTCTHTNANSSFCSIFGPEVYSEVFYGRAGQSLAFEWAAKRVSDDYEVYAFLVKTDASGGMLGTEVQSHSILLYGRGANQGWTTAAGQVQEEGYYRFRFVNGSYDQNGLKGLGSEMYISPNVTVGQNNEITFPQPVNSTNQVTETFVASATSGGLVQVTSANTTNCTVTTSLNQDGTTTVSVLKRVNNATCTLTASQGYVGVFAPAPSITRSFVMTVPQVPTAPVITAITRPAAGDIEISFTPAGANGSTILRYEYSLNGGAYVTAPQSSSPITLSDLPTGVQVSVALRAVNANGLGVASNSFSVTPTGLPLGVTSLAASSSVEGQASLAFSPPTNTGGLDLTNFEVSFDGVEYEPLDPPQTISPIVLSGLDIGESYTVSVRALNSLGAGPAVVAAAVTVVGRPSAPALISIAPTADQQLTLTFGAPANLGGLSLINYEVSLNGGGFTPLDPPQTSSPIVLNDLTRGEVYEVRIRAVNSLGQSAASAAISATTVNVPDAPGLSQVRFVGTSAVEVSFTPVSTVA